PRRLLGKHLLVRRLLRRSALISPLHRELLTLGIGLRAAHAAKQRAGAAAEGGAAAATQGTTDRGTEQAADNRAGRGVIHAAVIRQLAVSRSLSRRVLLLRRILLLVVRCGLLLVRGVLLRRRILRRIRILGLVRILVTRVLGGSGAGRRCRESQRRGCADNLFPEHWGSPCTVIQRGDGVTHILARQDVTLPL